MSLRVGKANPPPAYFRHSRRAYRIHLLHDYGSRPNHEVIAQWAAYAHVAVKAVGFQR